MNLSLKRGRSNFLVIKKKKIRVELTTLISIYNSNPILHLQDIYPFFKEHSHHF